MKYKIVIGGRGSETYVHKLNDSKVNSLKDIDLVDPDHDQVSGIIECDFFETDDIFLGPYNDPESYMISVRDENDNLVWESPLEHEFEDCDFNCVFDNEQSLIVEDYIKGEFFSYELETEKFEPSKLLPVITEIGEVIEIITELTYDGVSLRDTKDYLDYWSKGLNYYLVNP